MPGDLHALYAHGLDGLSYQIVDGDGHTLFASAPNGDADVVPLSNGKLSHVTRNGEVYGVTLPRGGLEIKVAQNVRHPDVIFDDIVAYYLSRIGWLTLVILAILLGIDILIIRDALRPVLRASRIAAAIDPARTDLRLPTENVPRELQPLILAMNAALARLEKGILLQREFTADAAHELRTPLAVLRARIETLPDHGVMATLHSDLEVMENVISHLLEIAEIEDAAASAMTRCDLQAISADVVSMLADRTIGQGKQIALTGHDGPVWITANATMVSRAIRNLADNAIRHTPKGTSVELEVTTEGVVRVSDSGPGVPEANRAFVFRRFWRARRDNSDGAGLGLAIVSRIAEIHGAEVTIADNEGGGAVFSIRFRTPSPGQDR